MELKSDNQSINVLSDKDYINLLTQISDNDYERTKTGNNAETPTVSEGNSDKRLNTDRGGLGETISNNPGAKGENTHPEGDIDLGGILEQRTAMDMGCQK